MKTSSLKYKTGLGRNLDFLPEGRLSDPCLILNSLSVSGVGKSANPNVIPESSEIYTIYFLLNVW